MGHQYSKFKDKNRPYAKVGRRVFISLFNAESYCSTHGLDVNRDIEYEDSKELKATCSEIAKTQKAILRVVLERLDQRKDQLHLQHKAEIETYVKAQENCDLLTGFYKEKAGETASKICEVYDCMGIVREVKEELERLSGWRD